MPKSVCVCGGGGGGTDTLDLSTFGKEPIRNELYLDIIWLFTNSHLCNFIEIVHMVYEKCQIIICQCYINI